MTIWYCYIRCGLSKQEINARQEHELHQAHNRISCEYSLIFTRRTTIIRVTYYIIIQIEDQWTEVQWLTRDRSRMGPPHPSIPTTHSPLVDQHISYRLTPARLRISIRNCCCSGATPCWISAGTRPGWACAQHRGGDRDCEQHRQPSSHLPLFSTQDQ